MLTAEVRSGQDTVKCVIINLRELCIVADLCSQHIAGELFF